MVLTCSAEGSVDHRVSANQTLGKEMSSICVLITTANPTSVTARAAHLMEYKRHNTYFLSNTKVEIAIYSTKKKKREREHC